jgi:hypothetical protein
MPRACGEIPSVWVSERPLDAAQIQRFLTEVADELPAGGPQRAVIVVGGALLALRGLRDATRDVDSIARLDETMKSAVARVASRHDLASRWLNDSAIAFTPATFEPAGCECSWTTRTCKCSGSLSISCS